MQLTTEQKEQLLVGLRSIATGPTDPTYGICWNLQQELCGIDCDTYDFVARTAVSWPDREGHTVPRRDGLARCDYPIDLTYDADGESLPLWEGEALTKRLALMAYLESYLTESLGTGDKE